MSKQYRNTAEPETALAQMAQNDVTAAPTQAQASNQALLTELEGQTPEAESTILGGLVDSAVEAAPAAPASAQDALGRQDGAAPRQEGLQERTVHGVTLQGDGVSPSAMDAAHRIVAAMIGGDPAIQRRLSRAHTRIVIVPSNKGLTELPDFAHLHDQVLRDPEGADQRKWNDTRGMGGQERGGELIVAIPEENLITVTDRVDAYTEENSISIHEFAHTIHRHGLGRDEKRQIQRLYDAHTEAGADFTSAYGASHVEEYFSEASQAFFDLHMDVDGPAWLQQNDPGMYAFLVELYGTPEECMARADAAAVAPEDAAEAAAAAAPPAVS